jgi:hypothetical protein
MKEAQPSVLKTFAGRSTYVNAGQRVVVGQRVIQANGDILLAGNGSQASMTLPVISTYASFVTGRARSRSNS